MKILDFMSFNVEWFLTTQGMLITGGVLLLLIALIILLTSGKKDNDEDPTVAVASATVANDLGVNPIDPTQVVQPQIAVPGVPTIDAMAPVEPVSQPEVSESVNLNMGIADVAPVTPSLPESPVVGVNSIPVVEQEQPAVPPVLEINSTSAQAPVEPVTPAAEVTPEVPTASEINIPDPIAVANANINPVDPPVVEQPAVSIYGGVNPTQDIFKQPEAVKPVIYGGADPLENTGAIPKVDISDVPKQPIEEVKVVEPTVPVQTFAQTAVVDNSVLNTVSAIPEVAQPTSTETATVSTAPEEEIETLVF